VGEGYVTANLVWAERTISVSYRSNWLHLDHWHIELRCAEPLPVTATGYRSLFVPHGALVEEADVLDFVKTWLDTAATSTQWQAYLADSRQLKLF